MESIMKLMASIDFDSELFIKAALIMAVGSLLLGFIGRYVFGKHSLLNHSVSAAIGILFVYAATIVFTCAGPAYSAFVAPLPFVTIHDSSMTIFSFANADYTVICAQVLSMIILAFLANLAETWLPRGKNLFTWLIFRCLSVAIAIGLHLLVTYLFTTYLPEGLVTYAPTILLGVLIVMLLVGALKIVVGAILATVNPLIAAFYTFFFATLVGKQLSKAVLSTLLLCGLVCVLNYIGCSVISIASAALIAYIPLLILLVIIWYVLTRIL